MFTQLFIKRLTLQYVSYSSLITVGAESHFGTPTNPYSSRLFINDVMDIRGFPCGLQTTAMMLLCLVFCLVVLGTVAGKDEPTQYCIIGAGPGG